MSEWFKLYDEIMREQESRILRWIAYSRNPFRFTIITASFAMYPYKITRNLSNGLFVFSAFHVRKSITLIKEFAEIRNKYLLF